MAKDFLEEIMNERPTVKKMVKLIRNVKDLEKQVEELTEDRDDLIAKAVHDGRKHAAEIQSLGSDRRRLQNALFHAMETIKNLGCHMDASQVPVVNTKNSEPI